MWIAGNTGMARLLLALAVVMVASTAGAEPVRVTLADAMRRAERHAPTLGPKRAAVAGARGVRSAADTALATPPTEDEMTRAVNGWRKSFYGRVEGVIERAQMISTYFHHTGHADYIGKDLERYTSLSAADVAAAGKRYLVLDRPLRIDILPETSP